MSETQSIARASANRRPIPRSPKPARKAKKAKSAKKAARAKKAAAKPKAEGTNKKAEVIAMMKREGRLPGSRGAAIIKLTES